MGTSPVVTAPTSEQAKERLEQARQTEADVAIRLDEARQMVARLDAEIEVELDEAARSLASGKGKPDTKRVLGLRAEREIAERFVSLLEAEAEAARRQVEEAMKALQLADEQAHREALAEEARRLRPEIDELWGVDPEAVREKTKRLAEIEPEGLGRTEWLMLEVARLEAEWKKPEAEAQVIHEGLTAAMGYKVNDPEFLRQNSEAAAHARKAIELRSIASGIKESYNRIREELDRRLESAAALANGHDYGPEAAGSLTRVLEAAVELLGDRTRAELRSVGLSEADLAHINDLNFRGGQFRHGDIQDKARRAEERLRLLLPRAQAALRMLKGPVRYHRT